MPEKSLSIYLTAVDGISSVMTSVADKTKALDKETQELQQTYEELQRANKTLINRKIDLQAELRKVNETVKDARKQFKELNDETSRDALSDATKKQQDLRNQIAATTKALQENKKAYQENIEAIRKGEVETQGTSLSDMAKGIFAGQIGQMFASSLGGLGQSVLTSAIGTPTASLISDTLTSAISGGAAGAMFGLPGIAAGAALGGVSGLISGGTKIYEAKDDAFKEYYGGLYDDVKGRSAEMVESGSTIAGGREQTRMAFSQRLGGDEEADAYLAQVEKMAASTNYEYDEIVGYAKLLLNSYKAKTEANADGTKETDVMDVLMALSDATAGLDLSSGDVNMMIAGLSRMRTTGKATQEYLNYFRERGVDVDQALADGLGVEKSAIADMVKKGSIGGEDAAQAILDFIQQKFGGLSDTLAGTYDALVDNLGDMETSINAAGGDAYNEERKSGLSAQQKAYEGELGEAMKAINAVIGENQARKENLQEQYMREVLDAVLNGNQGELWSTFDAKQQEDLTKMSEQYASLMERYQNGDTDAGAELEALYEEAQALGQAYFDNSDFVQKLNETERDEIQAIRDATKGLENATTASYYLAQELSKGRGVSLAGGGDGETPANYSSREEYMTRNHKELPSSGGLASPRAAYQRRGHAFGLERVPYDEYPALLHEGERVLTASEARAQDAGQGGVLNITVTGNTITGAPEELADQLAEIIVRKITQASIAAAPK